MSLGRAFRCTVLALALFRRQTKGLTVSGFDVNPIFLLHNFGILRFDNFFSDVGNLFWGKRRAVCGMKLLFTVLNTPDFALISNAHREDSVMILPEAGVYRGSDSIKEYVTFATVESPFVKDYTILASEATVVGYDGSGQCEFTTNMLIEYTMEESIVEEPVRIEAPVLAKLLLDYEENYLRSTYIFYTKPFLEFYFTTLATSSMAQFLCDNVLAQSGCVAQLGDPGSECFQRMRDLPLTTENLYVDGDSFGCRILHAAFAVVNPMHCAHVSLDPLDPDPIGGDLRCSESLQLDPADFFSEEEMNELVKFGQEKGVDPNVGYTSL